MKTLFKAFSNFMDRLGESDHFLRCAWIFVCTILTCGLATIPMIVNYRNLWEFSGPSLRCVENTPAQREKKSAARLNVRDVPVPVK